MDFVLVILPAAHQTMLLSCRTLKQSGMLVVRTVMQKLFPLILSLWMSGRYHQSK